MDAATFTIKLESSSSGTSGGAAPFPAGSPSSQPQKPFDPAALAQSRRDAEIRRQQVNDAYAAMFPKPDEEQKQKSIFDRLFKPSSPEARASAGFASMGLGMAGMHSAAGVVGGYAALGPAGAALAAINIIADKISSAISVTFKAASAVASLDPNVMSRGLADMAANIPLVGDLLGPLAHGILDLSDAVFQTAKRLAQYSGPLAMQQAMIEIRHMQRDIERAQQFGPQIMEAVEARYQFEEQIQDIMNENLPAILELTKSGIGLLTTSLPYLIEIAKILKDAIPALAGFLETAFSPVGGFLDAVLAPIRMFMGEVAESTAEIAQNTAPRPLSGTNFNMEEFGRNVGTGFRGQTPYQMGR